MIFVQESWLIDVFGWTLLHSVCQGAAIAFALSLVLRLMKKTTSNVRYLTCYAAMCLLAGSNFRSIGSRRFRL